MKKGIAPHSAPDFCHICGEIYDKGHFADVWYEEDGAQEYFRICLPCAENIVKTIKEADANKS